MARQMHLDLADRNARLYARFIELRDADQYTTRTALHTALGVEFGGDKPLSPHTVRKIIGQQGGAGARNTVPLETTHNPFPDKKVASRSYASVLNEIRRVQEYKATTSVSQTDATWIPKPEYSSLPIAVLWCCDLHFGSLETDYSFLERHLSLVEHTPNMYVAFGGDHVDAFNASAHPSAIWVDGVNPDDQFAAWADRLRQLDKQHKVSAMVWGNHEDFLRMSGINAFSTFFRSVSCPLFVQGGGVLTGRVGRQSYRLGMRHTYWGNSKLNVTNSPKRMIQFWKPGLDAAFVGHTHVAGGESYWLAGEEKVAVSGGTYKLMDSFHMQWGDDPHPAGFTVLLYPDSHKMQLCRYPEDAADIILGKIARLPKEREPKVVPFRSDDELDEDEEQAA